MRTTHQSRMQERRNKTELQTSNPEALKLFNMYFDLIDFRDKMDYGTEVTECMANDAIGHVARIIHAEALKLEYPDQHKD